MRKKNLLLIITQAVLAACGSERSTESRDLKENKSYYYCFYTAKSKEDWNNIEISNKSLDYQKKLWAKYEDRILLVPPLYFDGTFYIAQGCTQSVLEELLPEESYELSQITHSEFQLIWSKAAGE